MPPFLHLQPRLNVQATGRGTNASGLYRTVDPVDGLYMTWNGWEPGQIAPTGGYRDVFDTYNPATNPGTIIWAAMETEAEILQYADSPSNVLDYWAPYVTGGCIEARCGPEFVSKTPHQAPQANMYFRLPETIRYDNANWTGKWVGVQLQWRQTNAFFTDLVTELGNSNGVYKHLNLRNDVGARQNVCGNKFRAINAQTLAEGIYENYVRIHLPFTDFTVNGGETTMADRQEPWCTESLNYPGRVGLNGRNTHPGWPDTNVVCVDQIRGTYTRSDVWTANGVASPLWMQNDLTKTESPWCTITFNQYFGGPTEQLVMVDAATEFAGPFPLLRSENNPNQPMNRYPVPADPLQYSLAEFFPHYDSSTKGSGIVRDMAGWAALGAPYVRGFRHEIRQVICWAGNDPMPTARPIRKEAT